MNSEIPITNKKQKAIFLDRDGVINEEKSYIREPQDFIVFDFTPNAIKLINDADYKAIVITNQSAIARQMCTLEELSIIHQKLENSLAKHKAKVDAIYFCPHHPQYDIDCNCRKPKPGMLLQAAKDFNLDLRQSIIIGDTERDIIAGKSAGCYTAGVMTGYGLKSTSTLPNFFFSNLLDATNFLTNKKNEQLFKEINKETENYKNPYIIGIDGLSQSGKSNIAAYLKMRFEQTGKQVELIELKNWETTSSKKLLMDINALLKGKTIQVKHFSENKNWTPQLKNYNTLNANIIIIEGFGALTDKKIQALYSKKLFVSIQEEQRKERFYAFYKWCGKSEIEINNRYQSQTKNEDIIVSENYKYAHQIIHNLPIKA
jgi:D,D-heptose 1,7-bisphosphate phosphatase